MRSNIIIKEVSPIGDYKKGSKGFVDGYVRGADNVPYAVVVIDSSKEFVLVPLHDLEFRGLKETIQ